ncbi:transcription factor IIIA [Patella vulgata]|uniref:transcription factor IIIA n=1 Tax=Patella vulgata TaxID=6465 RepID=UPI0024A8520D|nr:transcription factor IIIA [Patella vulgata]
MSSDEKDLTRVGHSKFVCSTPGCDKTFGRRSRFLVHLRTHTGEKPFICEEPGCDKAYARAQHLKRHEQLSHSPKKPPVTVQQFVCSLSDCDNKPFSNECNLKRHIKTVHGKQFKYRCTVDGCKKKFAKEHQLTRHELQHKNTNPYLCTFEGCDYSCKIAHQLKRHSKIHEGYKCTEEGCDVTVETWTQLRKHKLICHPRVYECPQCNKCYKKKIQLKRHSFIHSSEQPLYSCDRDGCERVYLDLRNLKAHIRSYHDQQRLTCHHDGCSQTFVNKAKLLHHSKLHDPNRPPPKKMPKKGHRKKNIVQRLTEAVAGSDGSTSTSTKPITHLASTTKVPIKINARSESESVQGQDNFPSDLPRDTSETNNEEKSQSLNDSGVGLYEGECSSETNLKISDDKCSPNADLQLLLNKYEDLTKQHLSSSHNLKTFKSCNNNNNNLEKNVFQDSTTTTISELGANCDDVKNVEDIEFDELAPAETVDVWLECLAQNVIKSEESICKNTASNDKNVEICETGDDDFEI